MRIFITALAVALIFSPALAADEPPKLLVDEKVVTPAAITSEVEAEVPAATKPSAGPTQPVSGSYLSSYVAHSSGDVSAAIHYLKNVLEQDPDNQQIAGQLLVLEIMDGKIDEAVTLAQSLRSTQQRELIVDLLLAVDHLKKNDVPKARTAMQAASSQNFDQLWLPLLNAWLGSNPKAPALDATALLGKERSKKVPNFIHYHLGLINQLRGHSLEAGKHLALATHNRERAAYRTVVAYIQYLAQSGQRKTIQQLLVDIKKDRAAMLPLLQKELPYLTSLADGELPKESLVNNINDGVGEVLLSMASMLYQLDAGQDTALYLRLALHLRPDFPTAQMMLAGTLENFEHNEEAAKVYESLTPGQPLYLKAAIRRAYLLNKMDESDQAIALLSQLAKRFDDDITPLVAKGDVHRGLSDYGAALKAYDAAIAIADETLPGLWQLYFSRGAAYEQLGQVKKAEVDLKSSLRLSPNQPEVLNYLGYTWLAADKNIEDAFDMIVKAYQLSPDEAHIIDSMGWAWFKVGEVKKAIALLEQAANGMPTDATVNDHLGDAYWHAGRKLEARYQWERALGYLNEKQFDEAAKIRAKIKNGPTFTSFHQLPKSKPEKSTDEAPQAALDSK